MLRGLDAEFALSTRAENRGSVGSRCASRPGRFCLVVGGDEPRHDGADGSSAHRLSRPRIKGTDGSIAARMLRPCRRVADASINERPASQVQGPQCRAPSTLARPASRWLVRRIILAAHDRDDGHGGPFGAPARRRYRGHGGSGGIHHVAVVVATVVPYATGLADGCAVHDMTTMSSPARF